MGPSDGRLQWQCLWQVPCCLPLQHLLFGWGQRHGAAIKQAAGVLGGGMAVC